MVRSLVVAAVAVTSLVAQTTHVVGPGGFAQIRQALAVASPGDRIDVHPGTYAHFDVLVGVTIRALVPGSVIVEFNSAFPLPDVTRFAIPTLQCAHVTGLRFRDSGMLTPVGFTYHRVEVAGGMVTFDECVFTALLLPGMVALAIDQGIVHLQDCSVTATGWYGLHAIHATDAVLTAVGGVFQGSAAVFNGNGGDGIHLVNSTFQGSGLTARGGLVGATGGWFPGRGISANGGSTWVSDSVLESGQFCGSPAGHVARVTFGASGVCPTTGDVLGVLRPAPLQVGAPFTLGFRTLSNGFVAVFASPGLAIYSTGLFHTEPYLDPVGALAAGVFLADASGAAPATWTVPASPALVAQSCWFQGITGLTLPLRTSPLVGGIVR